MRTVSPIVLPALILFGVSMSPLMSWQAGVSNTADATVLNRTRVDSALRRMRSPNQQTRIDAFYDLTTLYAANTGSLRQGVRNLLRAHPERVELVKQALFVAAKDSRAIVASFEDRGENFDENISEYWANSLLVLREVRDARVVDALLSGPGHGGLDADLLADFLPEAAAAVIGKLKAPVKVSGSVLYSERWAAFAVLEESLTRQALMRAHPEVVSHIRQALLNATDDSDGGTRARAAQLLRNFNNDPEVRTRLSALARTDPHMGKAVADGAKNDKAYPVRAAAAQALAAEDESEFLYVMRVPETGECRVQRGREPPVGETYIGPIKSGDGRRQMCGHYESGSRDPYMCWKVYPQNACQQ